MTRIYPLPPSLVNQIAAGEVIERPASVVKELVENALDAGAQNIHIAIEAGGLRLIEVSDDGIGIHPEDLPLALMSHATSKIRTLEDLFSVRSLGFRGEALASIAAVSRFSIVSKIAECSEGYAYTWDHLHQNGNIIPTAHAKGTKITIRDLFFNTPVRRQFLCSEKTEWLQIENVVKRMALSYLNVGFQLKYKTLLHLPPVQHEDRIEARIKKIFGSTFLTQSKKMAVERNGMRLWGWIGLPSFMRSQNDLQYVYVNKRSIRDKLVNHAIRTAYADTLYPGRQPVCLLYLEIPPEQVDVNVHPTKHEVRFQEPRQIHDWICNTIRVNLEEPVKYSEVRKVGEAQETYAISRPEPKLTEEPLSLQWVDWPYGLIKHQKNILLCHYLRLYQWFCRRHFLQDFEKNQVISRPLLVPVRLCVSEQVMHELLSEKNDLERWGLFLSPIDEKTFLIRSFPALLPHLNFTQWLTYWEEGLEKKGKEEALLDSLILANQPSWPLDVGEVQAVLEDFQRVFSNDIQLKKCYRIMCQTDWEKLLR